MAVKLSASPPWFLTQVFVTVDRLQIHNELTAPKSVLNGTARAKILLPLLILRCTMMGVQTVSNVFIGGNSTMSIDIAYEEQCMKSRIIFLNLPPLKLSDFRFLRFSSSRMKEWSLKFPLQKMNLHPNYVCAWNPESL